MGRPAADGTHLRIRISDLEEARFRKGQVITAAAWLRF
jgi:hypothetical protein